MLDLGKMLKELRISKNLSQEEMANLVGVGKATIANYEANRRDLNFDKLQEILKVLNVSVKDFFSNEKENEISIPATRIPIFSNASAGSGKYAQEAPLDWLELPSSMAKNADFGAFVEGDSMEPKIYEDDLLLIRRTETLEDGEIGVFYLNENIYCKKFKFNPITGITTLRSLNEKYKPIKIENEDDFHIIGRVVGVIDYTL